MQHCIEIQMQFPCAISRIFFSRLVSDCNIWFSRHGRTILSWTSIIRFSDKFRESGSINYRTSAAFVIGISMNETQYNVIIWLVMVICLFSPDSNDNTPNNIWNELHLKK